MSRNVESNFVPLVCTYLYEDVLTVITLEIPQGGNFLIL